MENTGSHEYITESTSDVLEDGRTPHWIFDHPATLSVLAECGASVDELRDIVTLLPDEPTKDVIGAQDGVVLDFFQMDLANAQMRDIIQSMQPTAGSIEGTCAISALHQLITRETGLASEILSDADMFESVVGFIATAPSQTETMSIIQILFDEAVESFAYDQMVDLFDCTTCKILTGSQVELGRVLHRMLAIHSRIYHLLPSNTCRHRVLSCVVRVCEHMVLLESVQSHDPSMACLQRWKVISQSFEDAHTLKHAFDRISHTSFDNLSLRQ